MLIRVPESPRTLLLMLTCVAAMLPISSRAASCKTQSQMTSAERETLTRAALGMIGDVQTGNTAALQGNTIPSVAADFSGIAGSVESLKPLVHQAAITVDSLYSLDASIESPGAARTDFYCGTPVVVLNFSDLPPGTYALVILHATGVPQPQQISLILSQTPDHRWMLGGLFSKPMMEAGHDGLWYWVAARNYAQKNMNWDAWLYYHIAGYFLNPVDFLSSPNLEKLQQERDRTHPGNFPDANPLSLAAHGSVFQITAIDTTAIFGPLDLEVHYTPDAAQAAQLRDPPAARKQATEVMMALLELHPELHDAFHGMWVQADQGTASGFSLELSMDQIAPGALPPVNNSNSVVR